MDQPRIILLFSGKRKSGKDYICEKLKLLLGDDKCSILRISGPLKGLYATQHNLNIDELMSDSPYKEKFRLDMINWSDTVRDEDPGYFCKAACAAAPSKPIWIVSDIRRKTDIKWFKDTYGGKIKTIRISAEIETRKDRGWIFTEGVDDVTSECDLDDFHRWDLEVDNNTDNDFIEAVEELLGLLK